MRGSHTKILGVIGLVVALAACNWPQYRFGPERSGFNPYERTITPRNVSTLTQRFTVHTGGPVESSPVVVGGIVYFGSNDGKLYAADASTGVVKWTVSAAVISSPTVVDGVVYIGSDDGHEYAVDAKTGAVVWEFAAGLGVDSSAAVVDGVVYFASRFEKLYALDAKTGDLIWSVDGAGSTATPTVANGLVYLSYAGGLHALDAKTGAAVWTDAGIFTPAAAYGNGRLFIDSSTGDVGAVDATTGAGVWATTLAQNIQAPPAVASGIAYFPSDFLYAIDAATGHRLWSVQNKTNSAPTVAGGVVVGGFEDGSVNAFDATTGKFLWSQRTGGPVRSSPAVVNGMVYVGSDDGNLHAYGFGPDSDGDGLPDAVETNTGQFIDNTRTGTDPHNPDTDGDGLSDGDETLGTVDGLNLRAMGAFALEKNIFVETDWFDDHDDPGSCAAHSHRPTDGAIAKVKAAFAAAPVPNPDGTTGIRFVADYGQGGAFTGGNLVPDADGVVAGGVFGPDFPAIKAANFAANRHGYFHYVLMPHRYNTNSTSSGQAELPGDDLIVSLYCAGSDQNVANTIMHELGHNLGLHHGGNVDTNYKPNYDSVMNYQFQFPGVDTTCDGIGDGVLDYSHGTRASLDEHALMESVGICNGAAVDWNRNGSIDAAPVATDVNRDTALSVLTDFDDWPALLYGAIHLGNGAGRLVPPEVVTEQPVPAAAFR